MPLTDMERDWYFERIKRLDPDARVVIVEPEAQTVTYHSAIRSDESKRREAKDEELVRALVLCMLASPDFGYSPPAFYIEKYYRHGHPSSKRDEVDLIILDEDSLPYAMWELKSPEAFDRGKEEYIRYQLFGTAPLVGAAKLLVYATIMPTGDAPCLDLICIDHSNYQSYESWVRNGRPSVDQFPAKYGDPTHRPFVHGGEHELRLDCTQADFRAVAATFHNEFFAEHPDNILFTNLMKCLLAKIFDERQTKRGECYRYQILYTNGREETAASVFDKVNSLYKTAYARYIEPNAAEPDEINTREFPPERVKTVTRVLQGMSITRGAALHGDVIGAFFEEVLRAGFKQDKGMYFTHANLVTFMLHAVDLDGLTVKTWQEATHPENRLPYVIDPASGSGSFLLKAMEIVTKAIRSRKQEVAVDMESQQFYGARMSDDMPNYWAENFLYGLDPKFVMAITASVNMVLHGDGSAHVFKYGGLKPLSSYAADKLRPVGDPYRSIPRDTYDFDLCEKFDLVVSNPPFGITLSQETMAAVPSTFSLGATGPSESLFLERWFQLLKPRGRLAVVVPESLLNAANYRSVRLFLYRTFWIRAIVALPRNLFVETPTLTSLLFAQKKTAEEIAQWDDAWSDAESSCRRRIRELKRFLRTERNAQRCAEPRDIEVEVLKALHPIALETDWVLKRGGPPQTLALPGATRTVSEACSYYLRLMKLSGFQALVRNHVFRSMIKQTEYEYPVYVVDEVGYKLSKRRERVRPNQLCLFVGSESCDEVPNLHLATEPVELTVNSDEPQRVLDYMRRDIQWS